MGFYCEYIFPWIFEKMGDRSVNELALLKEEALDGVSGNILDLGFGVGLNLDHFSSNVSSITAIEPSDGMNRLGEKRINESELSVKLLKERAEALSCADNEFDAVVSTLTLCTVEDISSALKELKRVLKKDGKFYFLEHVASPLPWKKRFQDIFNPLNRSLACGCNMNRDTESEIVSAGFKIETIKHIEFGEERFPKFLTLPVISGIATV